jgi:hypothetical protein
MALRNGAEERYSNIAAAIPFCLGSWIVLIVLPFVDVVISDEGGDLVALSRHAALIVPSERNDRRGASRTTGGSESKI